jgi:uncharacterized membrane protein YsdA (DUF1294 family)
LPVAFFYMSLLSAAAFALCGVDKFSARRGGRRIPERTLFALAFWGGAVGLGLGMVLFRHKTRHFWFVTAVPVAAGIQLALLAWLAGLPG